MDFNEKQPTEIPEQPKPEAAAEVAKKISFWDYFFKRDIYFWEQALRRNWKLILIITFVAAILGFTVRTLTTQNLYTSRTALVRQEIDNVRAANIPATITFPRINVIFNLMQSRNCLAETIKILKLDNWSPERLWKTLSVSQASRNSNYLFISSTTTDPDLSARIANTLSEVFVRQYTELLHSSVEEPRKSLEQSIATLKAEISEPHQELQELKKKYTFDNLKRDREILDMRIIQEENVFVRDEAEADLLRAQLAEYREKLKELPETVEIYSERSTTREQELAKLKIELAQLRQKYTDNNPAVKRHMAVIAEVERAIKEDTSDGKSKIIMGKNKEYTDLRLEIVKLEALFNAKSARVEGGRQKLAQMRKRQIELTAIAPACEKLTNAIETKESVLAKQNAALLEIKMFLDRPFSDIIIHETALPNYSSASRHRSLFTVLGAFLGFSASILLVLALEMLNLTIRSQKDLEDTLQLPALGVVPRKSIEADNDFYSALQMIMMNGMEKILPQSKANLVVLASDGDRSFDSDLDELRNMVMLKDIACVIIRPASEQTLPSGALLINDYLYGITETVPNPSESGELFFLLDEMALLSPIARERIQSLYEQLSPKLVIWELFPYADQPQLYSDICAMAALTVLPIRWGKTSKVEVNRRMQFFKQCKISNLCGILFDVDYNSFHRVNL